MNKPIKFNHIIKKDNFSIVSFEVHSKALENNLINKTVNQLFDILYDKVEKDRKYLIVVKLQYENGTYKTLGTGKSVSCSNLTSYVNSLNSLLALKGGDYVNLVVKNLIFNYFLIDKDREIHYTKPWSIILNNSNKYELFELDKVQHYLPVNRNYLTWGIIMSEGPDVNIISGPSGEVYRIFKDKVEIYKGMQLVDTFVDSDFNEEIWMRKIGNHTFYIKDNKIVLTVSQKKTKFKNNPDFKLYYTDTDSAYIDKPLPFYILVVLIILTSHLRYLSVQ